MSVKLFIVMYLTSVQMVVLYKKKPTQMNSLKLYLYIINFLMQNCK